MEALIGAYLIACGPQGALVLMSWLGLDLLSKAEEGGGGKKRVFCRPPPSPLLSVPGATGQLNALLNGYEAFEDLIGYKFRDRSYLLQGSVQQKRRNHPQPDEKSCYIAKLPVL